VGVKREISDEHCVDAPTRNRAIKATAEPHWVRPCWEPAREGKFLHKSNSAPIGADGGGEATDSYWDWGDDSKKRGDCQFYQAVQRYGEGAVLAQDGGGKGEKRKEGGWNCLRVGSALVLRKIALIRSYCRIGRQHLSRESVVFGADAAYARWLRDSHPKNKQQCPWRTYVAHPKYRPSQAVERNHQNKSQQSARITVTAICGGHRSAQERFALWMWTAGAGGKWSYEGSLGKILGPQKDQPQKRGKQSSPKDRAG